MTDIAQQMYEEYMARDAKLIQIRETIYASPSNALFALVELLVELNETTNPIKENTE